MPRKIGDKDKKKRKSRLIDGIRQYPLTKGVSPLVAGAITGGLLGAYTPFAMLKQGEKLKSLKGVKYGAIAGAVIGAGASVGLASSDKADRRIKQQMLVGGQKEGYSPENRAALGAVSMGLNAGAVASTASLISIAKNKRFAKAVKKHGIAGGIRMGEALSRRHNKYYIGATLGGAALGAGYSYQSTKELNRRAGKNQYGPLNSSFSSVDEFANFARKLGSKDKQQRKRRLRRIATSLAAVGAGAYLGSKVGNHLIASTKKDNEVLIKTASDLRDSIIDRSGTVEREGAIIRRATNRVKEKIADMRYMRDKNKSVGLQLGNPEIPKNVGTKIDDIDPKVAERNYAFQYGQNVQEKIKADRRRVDNFAYKFVNRNSRYLGRSLGATIGGALGLGGLTLARKKYGTEKKNKRS